MKDDWIYFFSTTSACENLWVVAKKVFLLSHGQASVKRGFSVNKSLLSTNMKVKSIISKRTIVDHVRSVGGVVNVRNNKELLRYVRDAELYLEAKKKEESAETRKRKLAEEKINQLQVNKSHIATSFKDLLDSADPLAPQAEKEHKMELRVKSNAFRKSAQAKHTEITQLDKDIIQKRDNLKRT